MRKSLLIIFVCSLFSCELAVMDRDPADDPMSNFESMWNTIDQRYSFFTYKNIDWDSVCIEYAGRISDDMSKIELFEVMNDLLFELRDGHVNLITPFDVSRNWEWYLDYPENFNYSVIERNYLGDDHWRSGPLQNVILDSIGYIYYGSFGAGISSRNIDAVTSRMSGLRGIIIDVRNNGGGSLTNVETLVSRFADEERVVWKQLYKTGPGHNDFTDEANEYSIAPSGIAPFRGEVVILTNRKCYSATSFFVQAMKAFPNVTIIGDWTGGGGGSPIGHELPNGWIYRFSSDVTLSPDGFNIENGVPPDIRLDLNTDSLDLGYDSMIEYALDYLEAK